VGLSINPSVHTLYVANQGSSTASVINTTTNAVTATIPVGAAPFTVALDPTTGTIVTANIGDNTASVIDTTTNTVTQTIGIGSAPDGSAVNTTTGVAYTANLGSSDVSVLAPPLPPTIAATAATNATLNTPYSFTVAATGDPTITFAVSAGALPAGLVLNAATGVISGTPTVAGAATFTITATNSVNSANHAYSITVGTPPVITSSAPPAAVAGTAYTETVTTSGTAPVTFAVTAGALPAGLTLNAVTGVISGTPTTAANYSFAITATSPYGTASASYVLAVDPAAALPATGFDSTGFLAAGLGLVVVGAAMIAAVGRRRQVRVRP
jgi:LPXTG-motif cell wall-anchored protein